MAGIPQDVIAERTARRAAMGFQPPLPEESPLPHPPAHAHHAHTLPRSYHMPAPPMGMMYPSPVPYPSGYAAPPAPLVHPLPQGMPMPMPPRLPYGFPPPLSGGGGNFAEQHTLQTPASAPLPPVDQQSTSADLGDMARTDVLPGMNPAAPMEPGLLYRDESRSMVSRSCRFCVYVFLNLNTRLHLSFAGVTRRSGAHLCKNIGARFPAETFGKLNIVGALKCITAEPLPVRRP
jgi:hypothetical protein